MIVACCIVVCLLGHKSLAKRGLMTHLYTNKRGGGAVPSSALRVQASWARWGPFGLGLGMVQKSFWGL